MTITKRRVVSTHLKECRNESANITPVAFRLDYRRACEDQEERLRYFEKLLGTEECHPTDISARTTAAAAGDAALTSLRQITTNSKRGKPNRVIMEKVEKMPKYDAWVPVRSNYHVDEDQELEPYMPYTDDKNENRRKARVIHAEMLRVSGQLGLELSDGELGSDGEYIVPDGDQKEWEFFSEYSKLNNVRKREASRKAILAVFGQYGSRPGVMEGLSEGLNIRPMKRLDKLIKITHERYEKSRTAEETRRKRKKTIEETASAVNHPKEVKHTVLPGTLSAEAMKHFCTVCQMFVCGQHNHQNAFPFRRIRDVFQEIRYEKITNGKIDPCSNDCCFSSSSHNEPKGKAKPWTIGEKMILKEVLTVFRKDPCYLSVVIGTRTCREVQQKLSQMTSKSIEGNDDVLNRIMREKSSKRGRKRETNLEEIENANGDNVPFEPCYHEGDCDEKCTCVQNGHRCEATCGCNNVRFIVGEQRRGMARFIDPTRGFHGEHGLCSNTTPGCKCRKGKCNTNSCPCWNVKRACNPDICRDCDVSTLPQRGHDRRCGNIPASFAPHSRTIIGRSSIHGIGLFAAQSFDPGDLIGVYAGQLPNCRQANLVDNIYELKDKTFFFALYKDQVIDAGLLGSKMRFANHAPEKSEDANCEGHLVLSRGEGQIGLFATRSIAIGEEIRFDYKVDGNAPDWLVAGREVEQEKNEETKTQSGDGTNKAVVSSASKSRADSSQKPMSRKQSGSSKKSKRKRR